MEEEGGQFRHERLEVWRKAIEWAQGIYVVSAGFPEAERFGLQVQMRRAAVSVASNIAEGAGRYASADFARFMEIAYGSLMETVCQCTIALNLGYINADDHDRLLAHKQRPSRGCCLPCAAAGCPASMFPQLSALSPQPSALSGSQPSAALSPQPSALSSQLT